MTDDFKFSPVELKPPPQGPFGLAGDSIIGLGSRTTNNPNAGIGNFTSPFPSDNIGDLTNAGRGGGGGVTPVTETSHPFKIKIIPTLVNNQITGYRATISAGTINNILPSNIISNNQLEEFSYGANLLRNVVLTANSNQTTFTSATISLDGSAPPTQTPTLFALPSQIKILLGVVYNDTVYQIAYDNYILAGKLLYYTNNVGAPAGGIGYRAYFIWA